jgi:hypothetical protein
VLPRSTNRKVIRTSFQLDSFQLWRTICGSKLLEDITIILLLNKFDLLAQKLDSGLLFSKYVTSYKDQPNDADHVAKCGSSMHKYLFPVFNRSTCRFEGQIRYYPQTVFTKASSVYSLDMCHRHRGYVYSNKAQCVSTLFPSPPRI